MVTNIKRRALHRSKIIQGQMKGLEKKIESDEYCIEILVQSLAIQKSLSSLNKLVLENHLRTHINEKFSSNNVKVHEQAMDELLKLYELNNVRSK